MKLVKKKNSTIAYGCVVGSLASASHSVFNLWNCDHNISEYYSKVNMKVCYEC